MRLSPRPVVTAALLVVVAACAGDKPSSGSGTTTANGAGSVAPSTTAARGSTIAGDETTTTNPLLQKFVYRPDGFCQAFSNYITYGSVISRTAVGGGTSTSPSSSPSTTSSTIDAGTKEGVTTLVFAPSMAPTLQVLQNDAPEELLPLFKDFDVYNDAAVAAVGALGVDTEKLGQRVATELAAVDPSGPASALPDADSIAGEAGIDRARLAGAGSTFVGSNGTLQAVFDKHADIAEPSAERQKELIERYPCLVNAFTAGG